MRGIKEETQGEELKVFHRVPKEGGVWDFWGGDLPQEIKGIEGGLDCVIFHGV